MKMKLIIGGVASSAVIGAMAVVYMTAERAVAAVNPAQVVYVDRIIEVPVEVPVMVPVPYMTTVTATTQTLYDRTSEEDFECLAKNIYFEARGESQLGQQAVAWVTLNRVHNDQFPGTICEVVWQDSQFSWTHDGKSDNPTNVESWAQANQVAREVLASYGAATDPTEGATYFHADYANPAWRHNFTRVVQIDQHIFYADRG